MPIFHRKPECLFQDRDLQLAAVCLSEWNDASVIPTRLKSLWV
jgi:hypothetical protein